jgi:hypothetical protein
MKRQPWHFWHNAKKCPKLLPTEPLNFSHLHQLNQLANTLRVNRVFGILALPYKISHKPNLAEEKLFY